MFSVDQGYYVPSTMLVSFKIKMSDIRSNLIIPRNPGSCTHTGGEALQGSASPRAHMHTPRTLPSPCICCIITFHYMDMEEKNLFFLPKSYDLNLSEIYTHVSKYYTKHYIVKDNNSTLLHAIPLMMEYNILVKPSILR